MHQDNYHKLVEAKLYKQTIQNYIKRLKRYAILREGLLSPHDCRLILRAAKNDFLAVIGKLIGMQAVEDSELTKSGCQLVEYYLEATLMRRNMLRPGVVEHMTMQEWVRRTPLPGHGGHTVIVVMELKTPATQVASLQDVWFQVYFEEVRPTLLGKKRYNCPKVTCPMARRAFETATKKDMAEADKFLVPDYLTHSTAMAEKNN
ncbi:hypothetical protein JZ751_015326, partial [Albula glossodonta]